jgi:hypothetical protein
MAVESSERYCIAIRLAQLMAHLRTGTGLELGLILYLQKASVRPLSSLHLIEWPPLEPRRRSAGHAEGAFSFFRESLPASWASDDWTKIPYQAHLS